MELIALLQVVRRWLWMIVTIVVVTELGLWLGMRSSEPIYAATVRLQISTPQRGDVAAYDEYSATSMRNEITIAINNFVELLQSEEVRQRVISQLRLEDKDHLYTISVEKVSDADIINVTVEALTPGLAVEIANTHVDTAITYYGELHVKSTMAEKDLIAEQLQVAENELHAAENALADFRAQNGIFLLESQISTHQKLLEQLQLERDQRLLEQAARVVPTPSSILRLTPTPVIDLVGEVDKLIIQRQKELDQLLALRSMYDVLQQKVEEARAKYQHILGKLTEAELKAVVVRAANFIQIIEQARMPNQPADNPNKLLILGFVASLGFATLMAFLFDYISRTYDDRLSIDEDGSNSVMGIPILGSVPTLKNGRCEPNTPDAEAVRQLRTRVLLSSTNGQLKKLLVTSPQPRDGKTVVTANLGLALARGKSKVLLVDADLRAPSLHEMLDQPKLDGLANLLGADESILEELLPKLLRSTNHTGLSLLSAGNPPDDPASLLSSQNLDIVLAKLSRRFDFIVIDSPPVLTAPDASILAKSVDGIIFVLSPKYTSAKATRQAINTFNQRDTIGITGIALNRASWDHYSDQHYRIQGDYSNALKRILSLLPLNKSQYDPNLISVKQAAKVLGVQNKTVKLWCREGKLPAVKKDLQWWLEKDQLISFLHDRYGYSYSDQRELSTPTGQLQILDQPGQEEEGSDQIQIAATDLATGNPAEAKEQYATHPKLG